MKLFFTLVVVFVLVLIVQIEGNLKDEDIRDIAAMDDQEHFMNVLKNMLVPRVVGTQSWKNVQKFIVNELKSLDMDVELDSFSDNTPFGKVNFVNIIGKMNPSADKFLVLSAHYDSKYFQNGKFIGATDSSVPCSLMLNMVKTTLPLLKQVLKGKNLGLMLIFFDGEEAFVEWTKEDSIYGSRNLAKKWEMTKYKNGREIDRIKVLILLDLIGASNARFTCSFRNTCVLNKRLNEIENKLRGTSSISSFFTAPANIFLKGYKFSSVADDHVPFYQRNVPILHLIPQSFPNTWHTDQDDFSHLDQKSILNINKVLRVFLVDYLTDCTSARPSTKCRTT